MSIGCRFLDPDENVPFVVLVLTAQPLKHKHKTESVNPIRSTEKLAKSQLNRVCGLCLSWKTFSFPTSLCRRGANSSKSQVMISQVVVLCMSFEPLWFSVLGVGVKVPGEGERSGGGVLAPVMIAHCPVLPESLPSDGHQERCPEPLRLFPLERSPLSFWWKWCDGCSWEQVAQCYNGNES